MKISPRQLAHTLYDLTEGKAESETKKSIGKFVDFLVKSRKLKLAEKIAEQFSQIYNKKHSIAEVEVMSAKKLSEESLKEIREFVRKKYKVKDTEFVIRVDEKIKGGMILKVGDEVVDGSIAGKLSELKNILVK